MSEWMLAITVGPVGHFIAGGRRSRDLWWGSTWVSECSVEVARQVTTGGGSRTQLLIPDRRRMETILNHYRPREIAYGGRISNRVLARVGGDDWNAGDVAALAQRCETAARKHLRKQLEANCQQLKAKTYRRGNESRSLYQELEEVWRPEDFGRQVAAIESRNDADFLEFYAAWTPIETGNLRAAIDRVLVLLDGRKSARLFKAPRWTRAGQPKSDLDGGRDSVLKNAREVQLKHDDMRAESHRLARQRLGIGFDENLDALGLARRLAVFQPGPNLRRLPFPPLSRVAADSWLERVATDPETWEAFQRIQAILDRELADAKSAKIWEKLFFVWCSPARDPWESPMSQETPSRRRKLFRFDAAFLFDGGLDALWAEIDRLRRPAPKDPWAVSILEHTLGLLDRELRLPVRRLHAVHGPPPPYYALLAMDGDGVGQALTRPGGKPAEEALADRVRALNRFGDRAEAIVREHHGCPFYIGGDDVMAYLPIDKALWAARALATAFAVETREAFLGTGAGSLSGGLVFAHAKSDLRGARHRAEEALESAKQHRRRALEATERSPPASWLEIHDLPRSGTARACRGPLDALVTGLDRWQELLAEKRLSPRSAELLMDLRQRLGHPGAPAPDGGASGEPAPGVELAAYRILSQAERSGMENSQLRTRLEDLQTWAQVEQLAAELKIAVRAERVAALRPPQEVSS